MTTKQSAEGGNMAAAAIRNHDISNKKDDFSKQQSAAVNKATATGCASCSQKSSTKGVAPVGQE